MKRPLAAALVIAMIATPAGIRSQTQRHPYTQPHVLRYATAEDIVGLNPHLNQQATLGYMASLTMAWLFKFDRHNKPIPELATEVPTPANGGISADGKTITIHLRRDARWADGVPFTSDDVKFSVDVVQDPANNEGTHEGFDKIERLDVPDKYTAVFHLREPHASYYVNFFGSAGGNPCLLPKHKFDSTKINTAPYNELPIGIGPFKYESWKRGDAVVMVPDPVYFGRKPKLQKIVFKIIPDRNTVLTQLTTHELDLWQPVPPAFADRVKGVPGVDIIQQPSYVYDHIDLNMAHPPLNDPVVRRALMLAIDRATILDKVRHGAGILQDGVLPPGHPFYDRAIGRTEFSIAKANELLDRAGWKRGADGVRVKDGVRIELQYASSVGVPDTDQQIELIRSTWKEIGVDFSVRRYLSSIFFAPAQSGGILYSGKFDVTNFGWGNNPVGDLSNIYACDRVPPKGQNIGRYCNPAVDKAIARFGTTYDEKRQRDASRYIQEQMVRDVATIVLDVRKDTFAFNSDLKNYHPNQVTPFDDVADVDI